MLKKALDFANIFNIRSPAIIQAPMAGGITTPELVAAASNIQGLGSFATGYLNPEQVRDGIQAIKQLTSKPFAVNLFIPPQKMELNQPKLALTKKSLINTEENLNFLKKIPNQPPLLPPDYFADIAEIVLAEKVEIVSFTFGMLSPNYVETFKHKNVYLMGTATSVVEAQALERSGINAIVAQGSEAGGHRGGFLDNRMLNTFELVKEISAQVNIPVIAAGGIMNAEHILSALACGASAVQMGTAFIPLAESGASVSYKSALLTAQHANQTNPTAITLAYSGKPVRGLYTRFMHENKENTQIPDYPIPHYLTQPIRKEAARQNNPDLMSLFCGENIRDLDPSIKTVEQLLSRLWGNIGTKLDVKV